MTARTDEHAQHGAAAQDEALDDALARISDLAGRLWAVRLAHRPVRAGRLRHRLVCSGCGRPAPCPTLRAAG